MRYKVNHDFHCWENNLKDLKGLPEFIGQDFDCSWNYLTSLEGCPDIVYGTFNCADNQIKSLKDGPSDVKRHYYCPQNYIETLDGLDLKVGGDFTIYNNSREFKKQEVRLAITVWGQIDV